MKENVQSQEENTESSENHSVDTMDRKLEIDKEEVKESASPQLSPASSTGSTNGTLSSWMGEWTKRTLSKAAVAQRSMGELMSIPGKKYRELQEENELLRKRAAELAKALSKGGLRIEGGNLHTSLQTLRAGPRDGSIMVGSEGDGKLVKIRWQRRRLEGLPSSFSLISLDSMKSCTSSVSEASPSWEDIEGAVGARGFYQPTVDDIGCELRVVVELTRFFRSVASTPQSDNGGPSQNDGAKKAEERNGNGPVKLKVLHAKKSEGVVTLGIDTDVWDEALKFVEAERADFDGFIDVTDPLRYINISARIHRRIGNEFGSHHDHGGGGENSSDEEDEVSDMDSEESVCLIVKWWRTSRGPGEEDGGNKSDMGTDEENDAENDDHSEATVEDDGSIEKTVYLFPREGLRVQLSGEDSKSLSLVSSGHTDSRLNECKVLIPTPFQRDVVALALRKMREKVYKEAQCEKFGGHQHEYGLSPNYDYEAIPMRRRSSMFLDSFISRSVSASTVAEDSQSLDVVCGRCNSSVVIGDGSKRPIICACMCIYPSVAKSLDLFPGIADVDKSINNARASRSMSTQFSSMTSLISTALDPLSVMNTNSRSKANSTSTSPPSFQSTSPPSSPPYVSSSVSSSPSKRPTIYQIAGFDPPFTVVLHLEKGEGLGITLGTYNVGSSGSIVCITGFCNLAASGERGQLEKHKRVDVGCALVAVNGVAVVTQPEQTGVLDRVGKLINEARAGTPETASKENGVEESNEETNPAVKLTLTFASPRPDTLRKIATPLTKNPLSQQRSEKQQASEDENLVRIAQLERQLEVANAKIVSFGQAFEKRIHQQGKRMKKLCKVVEEERDLAHQATTERDLMRMERDNMQEQLQRVEASYETIVKQLQVEVSKYKDQSEFWKQDSEKSARRISSLEASMSALANDGEAWVNTLGTKEQALRALEGDLRAAQVRAENLEHMLDSTREEREGLRLQVKKKQGEIDALNHELEQAHNEADALTARLRQQMDNHDEEIGRLKHELKLEREHTSELEKQSLVAQTHGNALQEALEASEQEAGQARIARQRAEMEKEAALKKLVEVEQKLGRALEEKNALVEAATIAADSSSSSTTHSEQERAALSTIKQELSIVRALATEKEAEAAKLKGANETLQAHVNSLKSRVKGLVSEVSKLGQLDRVQEENSELMVKLKLAEASRLESEDELEAYKKALLQFAEQAKHEEMSGNGQPWTNRPQIFDHLYKSLHKTKSTNSLRKSER